MKRLTTDQQFEQALLTNAAVYVKHKFEASDEFIGALEGFNPVIVTISGSRLFRDDFEFKTVR